MIANFECTGGCELPPTGPNEWATYCSRGAPTTSHSINLEVGQTVATEAREPHCWFANTVEYPTCSGYESAGYTCVGSLCAAMNPGGTPSTCAALAPTGYTVDTSTGTCLAGGGGH